MEKDEDALWAMAYAVAASLLTLGGAFSGEWRKLNFEDQLDETAAAIATRAAKRLKGKLP